MRIELHARCPPRSLLYSTPALSGPLHFYKNKQLELYASRKATPLTLRQLVFFGKSMNEERLVKSANYVRTELPVRIAHRLRDMQALPYIVVTREGVAKVYELYWSAFEKLRRYPQIHSLKDNITFCSFLKGLLDEHLPVIPNLYLGLSLASHHLLPEQLDSFMRRMLVSRISRRVLAEHHLALSASYGSQPTWNSIKDKSEHPDNVGIIYTNLCVKSSIEHCITLLKSRPHHVVDLDTEHIEHGGDPTEGWPKIVIDGHEETRFSYIKEHMDYIVFELLKNVGLSSLMKPFPITVLPTIRATIVQGPDDVSIRISDQGGGLSMNPHVQTPSDLFSFSHIRNAGRLEDVRLGALRNAISNPKGIKGTVGEQVSETNSIPSDVSQEVQERVQSSDSPPHIGIGLPLSNIYAGYFGGSLQLMSMDGWGTDVYVRLPKLGTNLEGIEV
ncbi:alpha-ketoacid dehydrogenase kinase [Ramaria rubella]|nr:alpha-ketoacid dehydrogenase kinase [Ramaria rubella]